MDDSQNLNTNVQQEQQAPTVQDAAKPEKAKEPKPAKNRYTATGRRKESTARVTLISPGTGKISVNKRTLLSYFSRETHRIVVMQPLKHVKLEEKFDIQVNADGGGITGQAEATRHGISRALLKYDISLRTALKKEGYLTRDGRAKERKKYGRKRARKRFQYSKR